MMGTLGLPGSGLSYRQNIGPSYGGRGSTGDIPGLQQIIYVVIGISVIMVLIGMFS